LLLHTIFFANAATSRHNDGVQALTTIETFKRNWRPAILSALVAFGVFAVTLRGTYIYDDRFIVVEDPRVSHPAQWYQFWTEGWFPDGVDHLYRPLTSTTFGVQWWLNGNRAWAFHLVNLLLYAACAAAVAELARRMGGVTVAYLAGLLFAVHPLHTEVVAGLVGRADLLCTLFFLLPLILLWRPLTMKRVWVIFACCVLSLLSKEQGLLLPLVILLYVMGRSLATRSLLSDVRSIQKNRPAMWLSLLLCWTWAIYITFREWMLPMEWDRHFLDWTVNPLIRAKGASVWLMPVEMLGRYVQLLIVPWKLSIDYGGSVIGSVVHPADPYLYIGFSAVLIWVILMFVSLWRRWGMAAFCLLVMALTWGMVSNFGVFIGTIFAERLIFLPSVFFLILIAMALSHLRRRALAPILGVLIALGAIRSFTYARHWNNRLEFYEYSLRNQPRSVQLHLLVAEELEAHGKDDQAARILQRAQRLEPDYWNVWARSSDLAMKQNRLMDAQHDLAEALKTVPNPIVLGARRERLRKLLAAEQAQ
jgi:4-amino-4-deoxy-L-arabinose transferase-like glycosyltransferase